ncbi:NAD(P)H-binding protein [Rhodococcus sp. JS3073]|uniref:NAD(P)H-binding protein n=1 Tax=Rhodococcus sp. JS3073 TaxID=3002901 RepID=UPI002285A7B8|nr:hypothetical protein [Rhodococcus sp. JS3073]WAM12198.1 hypothetical protein OYT95_22390 [Rhodococcus sp. JS3073]
MGSGHVSISRLVAELLLHSGAPGRATVHRDDGRAEALRELGAEIVAGDLTCPGDVAAALVRVTRMFFNMTVSTDYLEATAVACPSADERGDPEELVNMSQKTVSQTTSTSTEESRHQRLHWLAERILNWSGRPVVHVRSTVFLDSSLFTLIASHSVADRGVLALPFGTDGTSPIVATDVARVIAALLQDFADRVGHVYELTGPAVLDFDRDRTITTEEVAWSGPPESRQAR